MDSPCVHCGFCCKRAPCVYGEEGKDGCKYLVRKEFIGDVETYLCGRADFIKMQPNSHICPAFGAGCSSTLFNQDRRRVIDALYDTGSDDDAV